MSEYMAYLGTKGSINFSNDYIDRQFILIKEKDSKKFIRPICPAVDLALRIIYGEYGDKFFNNLKKIHRENWMKGVDEGKGNSFEHYVKACLRSAIHKDVTWKLYYVGHEQEINQATEFPYIMLHINDLSYIRSYDDFNDYSLIKSDFEEVLKGKISILRIPEIGNLPHFDFDYINFKEREYCIFQVIIKIENHADSDLEFLIKSKLFKAFCNLKKELIAGWNSFGLDQMKYKKIYLKNIKSEQRN